MNDEVGVGWVDVSEQLIRDVLHAPAACRIVGAEFEPSRGVVRLLFASPELPTPKECAPAMNVTIRQVGTPDAREYVWSWNQ